MDLVASILQGPAGDSRRPAITVGTQVLSHEDLIGAAGAVARRVSSLEVVAVEATASVETVVALVGALAAGVPAVPVPPDAGPIERRHILSDCGAAVLLAARGTEPRVPDGLAVRVVGVDMEEKSDLRPAAPPGPGSGTAMILYTSGTTGPPKGVVVSEAAIRADLDALAAAWEWGPSDVLVHGLPLFHVHGLILGVLGPLRVGSPLVHTGRASPAAYAGAASNGGTLFFGVPTVWSRIAADAPAARALRPARLLVSGSAGLPVPVFERLEGLTGQGPIERYGMTETLITVSAGASGTRKPGWVGTPLPGVETRIVDESGGSVARDGESVGDLEVRCPTVMTGYLNNPQATAAVISADGWVRTGDLACIDSDDWHRIFGRKATDLIKTGGFRVGAGEVESALLAHPAVQEAAVVGAPDEDLGQVLVAFVVAEGVSGEALRDFVADTLSVHKRPRRIEIVDNLPRNPMGKVVKARLLEGF